MALILPLHIFDGIYRCCAASSKSLRYNNINNKFLTSKQAERLAETLIAEASIFDVIRWRRISTAFQRAADKRLKNYFRINVRMYNGLAQMHNHNCERDAYEWHPHATVMIVEMSSKELGIAIDTKMTMDDVRALIQLLTAFRFSIQELFMDSPIIEILVSQINRQQVNILLDLLRNSRRTKANQDQVPSTKGFLQNFHIPQLFFESAPVVLVNRPNNLPYGPFFPHLKKLTITSQSNQLEHLSRLLTYAVGVEFLYENEKIDLLCLKICMGKNRQWCSKPNIRIFRHVTKFRQWSEANTLGERYFQQFSGTTKNNRQNKSSSSSRY